MSQITLGTKQRLINTNTQFPVTFYDATWTPLVANPANAAVARYMNIEGFGRFDSTLICPNSVIGNLGIAEQLQEILLTAIANNTAPGVGEVSVFGPVPMNTIVNVTIFARAFNEVAEYSQWHGQNGAIREYQIVLNTGDTAIQFLGKLWNAIAQDEYFDSVRSIVNVPDYATMLATYGGIADPAYTNQLLSATSLPLVAQNAELYFEYKVTGTDKLPSAFVMTGAVDTVVAHNEGRNNFLALKSVFIEEGRPYYHIDLQTVPINGQLYTSLYWKICNTFDQHGWAIPDQVVNTRTAFELFLNECSALTMLELVATFLNQGTGAIFNDQTNTPLAVAAFVAAVPAC